MMLSIEDVASEMCDHEEMIRKEQSGGLPPGFRFHPTDEELITFYLGSKVFHGSSSFSTGVDIAEVDLNRCEPWDLPEEAKMGEREWYLFSLRDRKYPTGVRTNRATGAGYWKATGKDRQVYGHNGQVLGLKKTLVFYNGRAPRGEKTKWVMHEYRLNTHTHSHSHSHSHLHSSLEEEWVICRILHKAPLDKKHHPQQTHNHLMIQTSNKSPSVYLPPLLNTTTLSQPHHNPFQNHQQNNLMIKTLINKTHNHLSIISNGFPQEHEQQQSYDLTAITSKLLNGNTSSIGLEETTTQSNSTSIWDCLSPTSVAKQCKTEPNFSLHNNLPDGLELDYNITSHNPYQSQPLAFHSLGSSCPALGFSAPDDTSFNRSAAFHMMMLDF